MNENYIGKWYKEELGETVNIISTSPLKIKLSFSSSGYYNFDPNTAYEKDRYLCWEINDEEFRMVYHVKLNGDRLEGWYTQFGKKTEISYTLQSKTPDDLPFVCRPTNVYVPESDMTRLEALKKYAEYDNTRAEDYTTEYCLGGEMPAVLEKYGISKYLDGVDKTGDEIPFRLLDFVCDNFKHNGQSGMPKYKTVEGIIEYCENHDGRINCRGLAILLATIIRITGIKARHITCMPYEDPFNDCHVVVDCLLPSGKRVMLDPTNRLYYTDADGNYVSLEKLREMILAGETPTPCETASYNGRGFDAEDNYNYMTKNTFRFSRGTYYENGSDDYNSASRPLELIPKDYPTDKFSEKRREEFVYNKNKFWEM